MITTKRNYMAIKNKSNKLPPVSDTPTNNSRSVDEDTVGTFISPLGDTRPRSLYNKGDDGLGWLRKPSNDLPSHITTISSDISMLGSDGQMRVVDSYRADEGGWESQMRNNMGGRTGRYNYNNVRYDYDPYKGQPLGDPLDRSIHSSSGLRIGRPRNNNDSDNNDNNTSGLKV
jgi:hypothetical protein